MLCNICREGLQGIWDPSKAKRVCREIEFEEKLKEDERFYQAPPSHLHDQHPTHFLFGHHPTLESYLHSVADGCVMCCQSGNSSMDIDQEAAIAELGFYSLFAVNVLNAYPVMCIYTPKARFNQPMKMFDGSPHDCNLEISPSTGDAKAWSLVQSWMDTCVQTHRRCNQATGFVPSYLLELDDLGGSFCLIPAGRLSTQSGGVRYCTLSHCYNADDSLQLTTPSLGHFSRPQSLSTLPLAYRHAFAVVKRLGVRHLWIDHLCTLQDEPPLSNTELQDILSNSFCGIGATGSTLPSSGLFAEREPHLLIPTAFEFPLDAEGNTTLLKFHRPEMAQFKDEPLIQTARGFRERLLTPRMIHFGTSLISWECHGALCNEVNPGGILYCPGGYTNIEGEKPIVISAKYVVGKPIRTPPRPAWKPLIHPRPFSYPLGNPKEDILSRWFQLLPEYTRCTLADPDERLICIESAAMGMKPHLKEQGCDDTYLAGMWKETLPTALVWYTCGNANRPPRYRAPSWSWAAIDGPTNYEEGLSGPLTTQSHCELVDVASKTDEAGLVVASNLTLKGKLLIGKSSPNPNYPDDPYYETEMGIDALLGPDTGADVAKVADSHDRLQGSIRFDTKQDVKEDIHLFPINTALIREKWPQVYGIALTKLDSGAYLRCGRWMISPASLEESMGLFCGLPDSKITIE
ncbi:unnamed protein product [Clonostachys rosea f. rosea IK726]|uniref:Heterokaryon incompatibility domain-containing protein n=2 Tax=Bionectria ochroleuca TaxID=29856 RepID=A0A0B7JN59_BIOOC|nr:unnamed protein product [Clonostachys rosea f. rosea IK726]